MSTYFTDFSEYTTGVQPADWTKRFVDSTYTVVADAGATGGKVLRMTDPASGGERALSWDDLDGDANRANVEVLIRIRFAENISNLGGPFVRASGTTSKNAYQMFLDGQATYLGKYVANSYSNVGTPHTKSYTIDTWYWMRFRVNGTALQARRWAGAIGDEPGSWEIDTTDTSLSAAGWVGTSQYAASQYDVDLVGVGTNGDTAPSEPVSQSQSDTTVGHFASMISGV